jgi:hypothetical protein
VSGDSAAAYLLQTNGKMVEKAGLRLGAIAGQLGASGAEPPAPTTAAPAPAAPAKATSSDKKAFTMEEVGKHTTSDNVWVVINGEVLDVTNVSGDRPPSVRCSR